MTATITLTMAAAFIYGSGRWLRGISDLVSLVHFGRSGGRDHNAACFGTISWKARTLNDESGHYPNDGSGHQSESFNKISRDLSDGPRITYSTFDELYLLSRTHPTQQKLPLRNTCQ